MQKFAVYVNKEIKRFTLSGTVVNRAYWILLQKLYSPLNIVVSTLLLLHSWCSLYPRYPCSPPGTPLPPQPPGWSFYRSQPCSPTQIQCYCSDIKGLGEKAVSYFLISLLWSFVLITKHKNLTPEKPLVRGIFQIRYSITIFPKYSSPKNRKMMSKFGHSTIY